ncbi:MAG: addiction module protein [Victivallales bacterium]
MSALSLLGAMFGNYSRDSRSERERIGKLWADEAEDRLSAYERGEMKSVPAKEVFRRLETKRK